ncbi:MAG TPA: GNAT family N-acetyltransferase [Terracidiphilus sp.]|nr:GNAT family N-acetyltransferase [Terracidiphilus sp.]
MPKADHEISLVTREEDVLHLREEWDRLSTNSAHPNVFTTFDWFRAWYLRVAKARRSERKKPFVVVIRENGAVTGIAPLVHTTAFRKGLFVRQLSFAAREWDYNDLIAGDENSGRTEAVLGHLIRNQQQWDVVDLRDLRDVGNSLVHIGNALNDAGLEFRFLPEEERCPFMPIQGPWENYLSQLSGPSRHRLRKRQSKLLRTLGDEVRLRAVDKPHLEDGLLERMIALEKQKRSGGLLSVPVLGRHADVFESIWKTLGPKGWLCVTLMEWRNQLLAWQLLFLCGKKIWGYLTAYNHDFAELSPGSSLIPIAIDYGAAHGFTEFDFLSGEEPYKMRWTEGFHRTFRLIVWNKAWSSRFRASVCLGLRPDAISANRGSFMSDLGIEGSTGENTE